MALSLRTRLLVSYLFLLVITLCGITVALFIFLSARPEPPTATYSRLSTLAQGLNLSNLILEFRQSRGQGIILQVDEAQLLENFASTRNVRALTLRSADGQTIVTYDSQGEFTTDQPLTLRIDNSYNNPRLERLLMPSVRQVYGSFDDSSGTEWLFSALVGGGGGQRIQGQILMLADVRPTQSLQRALSDLGGTLLLPILQAGMIGLLIAVALAVSISRTIARPLQAASTAATAIAEGDLEQTVPVTGPSEVRSVARAFNRMSAEVRATQQAQRDFMANVSHDLKTPLTSIQGYSQAIIDGTAREPQHAAAIIHDEAARLNRMVAELTDLARMQAGQLSMHMAPLNLSQLVENVTHKLAVVAQRKGIKLTASVPPLPEIAGDGDRLVQVLNNLLDNAIKFTPSGGQVNVRAQTSRGGVEVIVQDTGIGIPKEDVARIFERFYQVDKTRGPRRGTGLGLAITHEIVQAHGGQIVVNSVEGQGTTFSLWFPSPNGATVMRGRRE